MTKTLSPKWRMKRRRRIDPENWSVIRGAKAALAPKLFNKLNKSFVIRLAVLPMLEGLLRYVLSED